MNSYLFIEINESGQVKTSSNDPHILSIVKEYGSDNSNLAPYQVTNILCKVMNRLGTMGWKLVNTNTNNNHLIPLKEKGPTFYTSSVWMMRTKQ